MPVPSQIGSYQLIEEIGRGGMGVVFRGFDPAIGRPVAIKIIRADAFAAPDQQAERNRRFAREAGAAGRLIHPGIVTVFHFGREEDYQYLVMELVLGKSLDRLLVDGIPIGPPHKGLDIVHQLAAALDYSHGNGVIHRDIKPANVLVGDDGVVKIVDFGIARVLSQTLTLTPSDTVLGTPAYMAPEQIMAHLVGAAADQFSLAVLTYQVLTGRTPFEGTSPSEVVQQILHGDPIPLRETNPTLPTGLMDVFQKALSKDPADRYRSCTEFAEETRRALSRSQEPDLSAAGMADGVKTGVDREGQIPKAAGAVMPIPMFTPAIRKAIAGGAILLALAGIGLFLFNLIRPTHRQAEVPVISPAPTSPPTETPPLPKAAALSSPPGRAESEVKDAQMNRSRAASMELPKTTSAPPVANTYGGPRGEPLPNSIGDGVAQVHIDRTYIPNDQMLHLTFKSNLSVTLAVDVNQNGIIDPRIDTRYGATADGARCTSYFLGEGRTTTCDGFPSLSILRKVQDGDTWIQKWDIPIRELDPNGRRAELVIQTWSKETGLRSYPGPPLGKTYSISLLDQVPSEAPRAEARPAKTTSAAPPAANSDGGPRGEPLPNSIGDGVAQVHIDRTYIPNDQMLHLTFKSKLSVTLAVDVNQNGIIDSRIDTLYGATADGARCTQYFLGEGRTTTCDGFPSLSILRKVQDGDTWIQKWDIPIRELDPNGRRAELVIQTWSKETGLRSYPGPPLGKTYSISLLDQVPSEAPRAEATR